MKIAFCNPPWTVGGRYGVRAGSRWPFTMERNPATSGYLCYPFFLAYAVAVMNEDRKDRSILVDSIAQDHDKYEFLEAVADCEVVVMESSQGSFENDCELARSLDGKRIIFVGPLAPGTEVPKDIKRGEIVSGEYECKIANMFLPRVTDFPFDKFPWPYRPENIEQYRDNFAGFKADFQLLSSRGCNHGCDFCLWTHLMFGGGKNQWVGRNPEDVRKEAEFYANKHSWIKSVYFDDDIFNPTDRRLREMSDAMRGFSLPWAAMCRADTSKPKTWEYAAKAGLRAVKFGIESASKEVNCNKKLNLRVAEEAIRACKVSGIGVHLTFVIGCEGETVDTVTETMDWILENDPDTIQVSYAAVFKGTPLYKKLEDAGMLGKATMDGTMSIVGSELDGQAERVGRFHRTMARCQEAWANKVGMEALKNES